MCSFFTLTDSYYRMEEMIKTLAFKLMFKLHTIV